jgi:hypothetical protein
VQEVNIDLGLACACVSLAALTVFGGWLALIVRELRNASTGEPVPEVESGTYWWRTTTVDLKPVDLVPPDEVVELKRAE